MNMVPGHLLSLFSLNRSMRTFFFALLICLVALSSAYANSSDLKEDYRKIEQYRKSKGSDPEYGGSSEDEIIQKWIDIIWNEGWVRKSGFDIHMGNIKRVWEDAQENKKGHALRQLNDFTDLIYADRSVGNVRDEAWTLSPKVNRITHRDNQVLLEFRNAKQEGYRLNIACFQGGVIHVSGAESGFFQGSSLVPAKLSVSQTDDTLSVEYQDEPIAVIIESDPFALKVSKDGVLKFHQTEFNVVGTPSDPQGVRVRFQASKSDEYLGFGERFDRLQHKHSIFAQWSLGMAEALSSGSSETYKPVPFYINPVKSTGMFYNHGGLVRWDLEGSQSGVVDVSSIGGICDYFLFVSDNPHDIYRAYTRVTGRIFGVSEWVHMPWMGHHFGGVRTTKLRRERLIDELVHYNKYGLTYGAMYAAGISSEGEEIQEIYDAYMAPLDLKLGTHLIPTVRKGKPEFNAVPPSERAEYFIMREDGSLFLSDHWFQSGCTYYDYSSPKVIDRSFRKGIHQIFMLDFGEQAPWDGKLSGYPELNGREFHNLYQYLYQRAAYLAHEEKYPNGDWMSFARSGWAGSHAIGGFFAGDHSCSMDDLESVMRAGINICSSGAVYWGADIGGYRRETPLTKQRYIRWAQFGCFSPLMRTHAHESKEMRPWKYDEEMLDTYKFYTWLRASLVPYLRECGKDATAEGLPIMRALPIEFPADERAFVDDEYMLGPSLLVAPYTKEDIHERDVYLPEGTWFNFFTNEKHAGKTNITQSSPGWEEIPVYVKAPAILPMRIGENSPQPGRSYFASAGTDMYTNPAIDTFRIYPESGSARAEFSHATVSYKNTKGAISLEVEADDLHMRQLHFEIVDVPQVTHVSVGNTMLSASPSWKEMMETPNHYYYDADANVLSANYAHR